MKRLFKGEAYRPTGYGIKNIWGLCDCICSRTISLLILHANNSDFEKTKRPQIVSIYDHPKESVFSACIFYVERCYTQAVLKFQKLDTQA
ncbi:MAG: hypothetical protein LBJ00_04060 [Planctomycetaceae bacterium]|nr:hypothetical protein [Planctomycetaceae bacterium]